MPSITSVFGTIRRLGVVDGSLWLTRRLASVATFNRCRIDRYYFVAQPVPSEDERRIQQSANVTLRQVGHGDPLIEQFPRPASIIAYRYAMGAVCFAAERDGRFMGYLWLKEARYPEDEVRCNYLLEPAGVATWDFDLHIEPAFRYGRTFARLWDCAYAWMRERGYRWTLSRISAFNFESIAAHRRLGARRIGSAIFVSLGSAQLSFLDLAPFVHASFGDDQGPTLRLHAPE
jgi:hypothetical protein